MQDKIKHVKFCTDFQKKQFLKKEKWQTQNWVKLDFGECTLLENSMFSLQESTYVICFTTVKISFEIKIGYLSGKIWSLST